MMAALQNSVKPLDALCLIYFLFVWFQTSSLPVVVVSNTSQVPSAWVTIMWCNLLCSSEPQVRPETRCSTELVIIELV